MDEITAGTPAQNLDRPSLRESGKRARPVDEARAFVAWCEKLQAGFTNDHAVSDAYLLALTDLVKLLISPSFTSIPQARLGKSLSPLMSIKEDLRRAAVVAMINELNALKTSRDLGDITDRQFKAACQAALATLPNTKRAPAPPLYAERMINPLTGKRPTADEFFNQHYRARLAAGELTANDLRKADFPLYQALAQHLARNNKSISELFGSRRAGTPTNVELIEREKRKREATRLRVARHRAEKRGKHPAKTTAKSVRSGKSSARSER